MKKDFKEHMKSIKGLGIKPEDDMIKQDRPNCNCDPFFVQYGYHTNNCRLMKEKYSKNK